MERHNNPSSNLPKPSLLWVWYLYYVLCASVIVYMVSSNHCFSPSELNKVMKDAQLEKISRILWGSDCNLAGVQLLATKATWMTIEMAINGLIYWVSCTPRWPRELWVCNLCFLSVISLWLILRGEFNWKKSFNKARTIFSLSGQREGHHLCFCIYSTSSSWSAPALSLSAFLFSPELVVLHRSHPRERTKVDLFLALWQNVLEMESSWKMLEVL